MRLVKFSSGLFALLLTAGPAQATIDYIYDKNAKAEPALTLNEQRHWSKLPAEQSCSELFWDTQQEELSKQNNRYCLDDNDLHNGGDYTPFKDKPVIEDTHVGPKNTLLLVKENPGLRYIKLKYFVERDVPVDAILSPSVAEYNKYKLLLNRGGDSWQKILETISQRDNKTDGTENPVTKSSLALLPTDKGTLVKHSYQTNGNAQLEECYALDETNHLYQTLCPQ